MMKTQNYLLILFLLSSLSSRAFSADDPTQEKGVKVNGVVFDIAKDRRIEKVGGVYNPEGIDKYVDRRLVEMTARLQKIETQLDETNKKLDKVSEQLALAATSSTALPKDNPHK